MIAEFSAAMTSLNLLRQMAQGAIETRDQSKAQEILARINPTILDLHAKILAAQLQSEELFRNKMEAEEKLKSYEQWETERTKYELHEVAQGVFVYAMKPTSVTKEPMHWICPNCYKDRKKSILQFHVWHEGKRLDGRVCPECNTTYAF